MSHKTTTPRVLLSGERPRRDDCGREDPRGSAFWSGAAWSGGRSQVAGAAAEERTASRFGICGRVPATMSAARESHPHGVKRSASPDDDVNNNGGVDEG